MNASRKPLTSTSPLSNLELEVGPLDLKEPNIMLTKRRLAADLASELRKLTTIDLQPGDRLPSEKELAERFGVSRNTVREALLALWDEGLLVRKWGVGTFVREADQPSGQSISSVVPVHDLVRSAAHDVTLAEAFINQVPCPDDAATALAIEPGELVWHVDRTIAFDGKPAFILGDWFPLSINGRQIDATPLHDIRFGLLDLLQDTAKAKISRIEAQLNAVAATVELAKRLMLDVGTPLISAEQVSVDNAGQIAIFSRNYYDTKASSLHLVRSMRAS
jgi:GntR family transcriptional regulator